MTGLSVGSLHGNILTCGLQLPSQALFTNVWKIKATFFQVLTPAVNSFQVSRLRGMGHLIFQPASA